MSIVDLAARVAVVLERPAGAVRPVRAALAARAARPPASAARPAPRDPASRRDPADLGGWAPSGSTATRRCTPGRPRAWPATRATSALFPVFRAHPLLFQSLLSVIYRLGRRRRRGPAARRGARRGHRARRLPARPAALRPPGRARRGRCCWRSMPYHVVVSRQVLLDVPMTFMATTSLYFFARFCRDRRLRWLLAAGAAVGATVLAKETGVLLVGGGYAFFALTPASGCRPVTASSRSPRPSASSLSTRSRSPCPAARGTGQNYLLWQLFRRANHSVCSTSSGARRRRAARDRRWPLAGCGGCAGPQLARGLCCAGSLVPVAFFAVAGQGVPVPAARCARRRAAGRPAHSSGCRLPGCVGGRLPAPVRRRRWLAAWSPPWCPSLGRTGRMTSPSGDVPGRHRRHARRPRSRTVDRRQCPEGAMVMTIGPSMANILGYYGDRTASGCRSAPTREAATRPTSRSPTPTSRTPRRHPVRGLGRLHRYPSPFFADGSSARRPVQRARRPHRDHIRHADGAGGEAVIVVYQVRP